MRAEIKHSAAFALAVCELQPEETIAVTQGAMMSMSHGLKLQSKVEHGLFGAIKRKVAGLDAFLSIFSAPSQGGWIQVVSSHEGGMFTLDLNGEAFILEKGSWVASSREIDLSPAASVRGLIMGAGLVYLRASGVGTVVGATHGAVDIIKLQANEGFTVDTGHLVGWSEGLKINIHKVSGIFSSIQSKEGLVADVEGPGTVITQSRPFLFHSQQVNTGNNNSNNNASFN